MNIANGLYVSTTPTAVFHKSELGTEQSSRRVPYYSTQVRPCPPKPTAESWAEFFKKFLQLG